MFLLVSTRYKFWYREDITCQEQNETNLYVKQLNHISNTIAYIANINNFSDYTCQWWRYYMETLSALWTLFRGIHQSPVNSPHKGSVALMLSTRRIDQSHRYGRPQAACHEPAGSYDKTTRTDICFEHKTQYILILAPYTRIVVFWHISNIPPMISQSQITCNTPTFYIAAILVKYCYTTGTWLL